MMNEWIISSSVLIAAVLLGRFLLRGKISLRLQYALWAVVLLRLLLPVQIFTSDFGTGTIAKEVDISAPVRQVYVSANEHRYEREYDEAYQKVVAEYEAQSRPITPDTIEKEAYTVVRQAQKLDLQQLLYQIWFAGMAVMAIVIIFCNVHLSVQLKRRRWELEVAESLLPVYITEVVPTPCIFGLFQPAIYLTPDAAKDGQVRSHVLEHELTHYRHWDHVWSVLRSLCLVLHWYNPLVWAAAKVSQADAELACDEGTLARLGEEARSDYGRTLIGLTCTAPISDLLITATTMTGSAGSIRERIKLLMKRPRNTVLTLTAVILLVTFIVGCTFSGAPATTQPPETTEPGGETHWEQTDLTNALAMDKAMEDYADKNPRMLTAEEIAQVQEAFASTVYDEQTDAYYPSAVSAFFTSYYDDVTGLDFSEFLRYFPVSGEATEEEFQLLRQKYGADFDWAEHESLQDMPVPVHRYTTADIDAVTRRYANLSVKEIQNKEPVYYLEETDSYYNFTSDFGPGAFRCVEGFVYEGGAILYSENAALFLTEAAGHYSIRAHLPLIAAHNGKVVTSSDSFSDNGLLVYPGTWWGMTESELLEALGITNDGIFSGMQGIHLPDTTFCGYPASIAFYFDRYRDTDEWGLCNVRVQLENEEDANAVYTILYEQLGRFDFETSGVAYALWWSDSKLEDMMTPEAWAIYQNEHSTDIYSGQSMYHTMASSVDWFGGGIQGQENMVCFSSRLHLAHQIEAMVSPITADYARETFHAARSYHCGELENICPIGFTIHERITDVRFGSLEWVDNGWQMSEILYTTTELKSGWGFLAEVVFWGDATTYGISFTDATGEVRHFAVSISGEDGSLICAEYAPVQTFQVPALFAEGGDRWYLAALAAPYADYYSFDPVTFFSAGQTAVALTEAEKAVVTEAYGKKALEHTVCRMTEEEMDTALDYAGTMVWNVDLSEFLFCNETASYLLVKEEVPELRRPEIISCEQLAENQIRMIYRFPGEEQRYCATLLKAETWKVYSNHLLLEKPQNARALTEEEIAAVRLAFSPSYYDAAADESYTNPRAGFLLDMYSDISEMSRSKFLSYYPATEQCEDEAEFQLLKKKYPEAFETEQTHGDMNWPIHRIPASELKAVMAKYTLASWDDLPYGGWCHYLEETDCYYTYYSDVGLFGFHCTGGWIYDGGAMLYNDFSTPMSVLILTEQNGDYYIQAHLPALISE